MPTVYTELCIEGGQARRASMYAWLAWTLLVTGCGIHLHHPQDAQMARTAAEAFKDAKLTEALKAESDAASEMLNSEIAAIRRQSTARRDRLISAVIGGTTPDQSWGRIVKYADKRLGELLGPKPPDKDWEGLNEWIAVRDTPRLDTLRTLYMQYEATRTSIDPRIPRIGARIKNNEALTLKEPLKSIYKGYVAALTRYDDETKKANMPPAVGGSVSVIKALRDEQETRLSKANEAAQKAEKDLKDTKDAQEGKTKETKAPGTKADEISKSLKDAADKTDKVKPVLQELLNAASESDLVAVNKRITALEEIREQISGLLRAASDAVAGKELSPGDSEKIKLLESVSAIRTGIDGAAYPRVSDLILESERLRIEIDRLRGLVALEEERRTLFDLQLTALSREIVALRRAKQRAVSVADWNVLALETSLAKQEAAADSLAYLAESWSSGRTPAEEIDFLLCGIDHRAAIENSSAAFMQWSNLIGVPLSQLVAYHESGIKSEDLANLINAAGFSAIAAGVN